MDLAFVDVTLSDGPTGIAVGRGLRELGTTVVFVTGNVRRIPEDFAGAVGVIEKPYPETGLVNAIEYLGRLVAGEVPQALPPCLIRAPAS